MISLQEFRTRRLVSPLTDSLAELSFQQLFEQWLDCAKAISVVGNASYEQEAKAWVDLLGLVKANEIMDDVRFSRGE